MLSCWAWKSAQLFPRHTCSMFVCFALGKKGLVWVWGGWSEVVVGGSVWQEKPSNRISVWKCAQYPTGQLSTLSKQDNLTSHSNVLWRLDNIFSMRVTPAAEKRKRYLLTCRARLYARVLALLLVSNGREFCSVSGLKKRARVKLWLRRAIFRVKLLAAAEWNSLFSWPACAVFWEVKCESFCWFLSWQCLL